jgi:hypothetical protein
LKEKPVIRPVLHHVPDVEIRAEVNACIKTEFHRLAKEAELPAPRTSRLAQCSGLHQGPRLTLQTAVQRAVADLIRGYFN